MSRPEENLIAEALAAPFDNSEVKFKPQTVSGSRALALPYVDARVIQDRLDTVLGVMGWQDSYECLPDGAVVCRLKIRLGETWITKEDVGGQSEQPDEGDRRKAAFSDALKRAAVKFGIGRYLYRQKPQWVDYDPQKRQFKEQPKLPEFPRAGQKAAGAAGPRAEALARTEAARVERYGEAKPVQQTNGQAKAKVNIGAWLAAQDAQLVAEHLARPDEMRRVVGRAVVAAGHQPKASTWGEGAKKVAKAAFLAFKAEAKQRADSPLSDDLLTEMDQFMIDKAAEWPAVCAKLGIAATTTPSTITGSQALRAIAWLESLPDAVPAEAAAE